VAASRRPTDEAEAIGWLVRNVPERLPILDEHVAYNDELLRYVVFEGDFLRWFAERVRAGHDEPAQRFVAAIERLMRTDVKPPAEDPVWTLAAVCFAEGLVMAGTVDDVIERARPWMGPNTSHDVDRMFRYRRGELPPTT
jgi:hypothetical protein